MATKRQILSVLSSSGDATVPPPLVAGYYHGACTSWTLHPALAGGWRWPAGSAYNA